jgi:signal recognition particle GTPase
MPGEPYTFDEMRADLVRSRMRFGSVLHDQQHVVLDRMITLIDAMTPEERKLSNVLQFSPNRQEELAAITGTSLREVQGLIAGRQNVEFVKHVYLPRPR